MYYNGLIHILTLGMRNVSFTLTPSLFWNTPNWYFTMFFFAFYVTVITLTHHYHPHILRWDHCGTIFPTPSQSSERSIFILYTAENVINWGFYGWLYGISMTLVPIPWVRVCSKGQTGINCNLLERMVDKLGTKRPPVLKSFSKRQALSWCVNINDFTATRTNRLKPLCIVYVIWVE